MPSIGSRAQLWRDLVAFDEMWSGSFDQHGNPWVPIITKPLREHTIEELEQLTASWGIVSGKVGRPACFTYDLVADIEYRMRERDIGVLEACRSYDREISIMWRTPLRPKEEREAAARAIAKRYYRARKARAKRA